METLEAIRTRRSIREFSDRAVSEQMVEKLLRAAMRAPSAGNQQPWWFVVIRDSARLAAVADIHPHAQMCRTARLAVLVCGDTSSEKYPNYWIQDCSAATENLLLAAHDVGLGAVWCGIFPRVDRVEKIQKLFAIPDTISPFSIVPVGWPGRDIHPQDTFRRERIFTDVWGNF